MFALSNFDRKESIFPYNFRLIKFKETTSPRILRKNLVQISLLNKHGARNTYNKATITGAEILNNYDD